MITHARTARKQNASRYVWQYWDKSLLLSVVLLLLFQDVWLSWRLNMPRVNIPISDSTTLFIHHLGASPGREKILLA